jgi:hypothetical protein
MNNEAPRGSNIRDVHLVAVAEQARAIRLSAQRIEAMVALMPSGTDLLKDVPLSLTNIRGELRNISHNMVALIARVGTAMLDE